MDIFSYFYGFKFRNRLIIPENLILTFFVRSIFTKTQFDMGIEFIKKTVEELMEKFGAGNNPGSGSVAAISG